MRLHRLIPILIYKDGSIVRSQNFSRHYKIGNPYEQFNRYMSWDVDEIVYLDISTRSSPYPSLLTDLAKITRQCHTPIAAGGSIHSIDDIGRYLDSGADRVVLGSAAVNNANIVDLAARKYGSQAILISVDYKISTRNCHAIYTHNGNIPSDKNIIDWVRELHTRGASEILLHSIDRDGTGNGFDIELVSELSKKSKASLITCGGAGNYEHFSEAIIHGASAVAASNFFTFRELAYELTKDTLAKSGIPIRYTSV